MKKDNLFILVGLFTILLIWAISALYFKNPLVLPAINQVLNSLIDILSNKRTYLIIFNTFFKLFLTIALSLIVSLVLALLSYISIKFESFIKPLMVIFKTIPIVSIIILLLILLGNSKSPYIMTIFVILPIMYEGILTGLKNINPEILDDVKTISVINFPVINSIYLPLIYHYLILGVIQSFGIGLKVMIMGEFITQPKNTIGYIMQLERGNLNTSAILAWTVILILIILVIEILINIIKNKLDL